ncbi:MAG: hypothetical protein JNM84_23525, partial [Planctomycetes bacterium]|nr:hypothetical protein [Planctomycetota bacterium]
MEPHDKDEIRERALRGISKEKSYEEKKRLREHAKQRKAKERRPKHRRETWSEDDAVDFAPWKKRERLTTGELPANASDELDSRADLEPAVVLALASGRARVRCGDLELDLPLAPELRTAQQSAIAVGDGVAIERRALVR